MGCFVDLRGTHSKWQAQALEQLAAVARGRAEDDRSDGRRGRGLGHARFSYTARMPKEFIAQRLDVKTFAEDGAQLSGADILGAYPRLMAETEGRGAERPLAWSAQGETRNPRHVQPEVWLHLQADTVLSLSCQRCLAPVDVPVSVDRSFRFVADEATAEAQDDEAEEDLLALSRTFDLPALVEDEVLMEIPLVPQHDTCPAPVKLSVQDADFEEEAERPNPFAALARLKGAGGNGTGGKG